MPLAQRTEKLLQDAKAVQGLDLLSIYDDLRRLGGLRRKHLRLRYEHNLLRVHLELLLKRRLSDVVPPPPKAARSHLIAMSRNRPASPVWMECYPQ